MKRRQQKSIFINYRRHDAGHAASRLFRDLIELFGPEQVFIDHEKLAGGESWGERLAIEAANAAVMLVLIGSRWLKAHDLNTVDQPLCEDEDWVIREIQTALDSARTVIPILVDDARPLTPDDLLIIPEIANLAEKQAMPLRRKDWDTDVARLQNLLRSFGIASVDKGLDSHPSARPDPPVVPPHFRDRAHERSLIAEGFRRRRACALVAIGGSGKTAIAASIASDRSTEHNCNVVWLSLAGTSDPGVPQEWLANAFGSSVRSTSSNQQRCALLRSITKDSSTLIVLDDPASDAQLCDLMSSIGRGNDVLITTRERLPSIVRFGVKIVEVPPLPTSDAKDVLLSILGMENDSSVEHGKWDTLAKAVGNHPLALEVLGGDLQLQDQVDPTLYLRDRIANGTWSEGEGTLARLRKSLVDSVARSCNSYETAFAALGAFEGSAFSVEAVTEVCAFNSVKDAYSFLIELRKRHCVHRHRNGLYSLHPFVTDTARQLSAASSSAQAEPKQRHITYYRRLLQSNGGYEWNIHRYPSLTPEERELVHAIDNAAALADEGEAHPFRVVCAEMTLLISWFLHWRGHWDLRIRLCERICAWAEREERLPQEARNLQGMVGNLYVDQGWIHFHRGNLAQAEHCALQARARLQDSGDLMFATELLGQIALGRRDYAKAIGTFGSLRSSLRDGTRSWMVFSYRLADALSESGDHAQSLGILEDLLHRTEASPSGGEQIDDVHARVFYRVALRRQGLGRIDDAIALARRATIAFARSGIVTAERRDAILLLADLLSGSGAVEECRQCLVTAREQAEMECDFETLKEIRLRQAAYESHTAARDA